MSKKSIFVTRLTDTSSQDLEGVGTIRQERNKQYKWVQFNNGAGNVAAVAGLIATYYAVGGDGAAANMTVVTMDQTDSILLGAGAFMSVPADGEYCWIQTKGYHAGPSGMVNAGADGTVLIPDASVDGELTVTAGDNAANAGIRRGCAVALDASAHTVLLDCPD